MRTSLSWPDWKGKGERGRLDWRTPRELSSKMFKASFSSLFWFYSPLYCFGSLSLLLQHHFRVQQAAIYSENPLYTTCPVPKASQGETYVSYHLPWLKQAKLCHTGLEWVWRWELLSVWDSESEAVTETACTSPDPVHIELEKISVEMFS